MTDQPATTPAADRSVACAYCGSGTAACPCCEACSSSGGCTHEPPPEPAADRVTLRCGDLRDQLDQARRERDEGQIVADALSDGHDFLTAELTKALTERDQARAEVVAYRTAHDDLVARVRKVASEWERACENDENGRLGYHATEYGDLYAADLRAALDGGA